MSVAQQIEEYLAYSQRVDHQPLLRIAGNGQGQGQLDPFCIAVALHQGSDILQQLGQVMGDQLQLDLALFQL